MFEEKKMRITHVLLLITLFFNTYTLEAQEQSNIVFRVFIDAGSSSSKLHVFKITSPTTTDELPTIEDLSTEADKIKPGIANFVSKPEQVGQAIKPLFDKAAEEITQAGGDISQTPLYLYATAGMRFIPQAQQTAIYNNIQATLKEYKFKNTVTLTISGQQEGMFSWLTANYLLKELANTVEPEEMASNSPLSKGVMDLGGASTQITWQAKTANDIKDLITFTINQKSFTLFSHSFLGLGLDKARAGIYYFAQCYPAGYKIPETRIISAGFNWENCRSAILALLINLAPFEPSNKSVKEIVQPIRDNMDYLAISGYAFNFSFFTATTPELLKQNAQPPCNSWQNLKDYDKEHTPEALLGTFCFNATYIYTLLSDGYGFAPNSTRITPTDNIKGQSTAWPLGAALYSLYN